MTSNDISSHLLSDWVRSFPAAASSSFMGWPSFLLQTINLNGSDLLALRQAAGRSERQWKGVLSWMLGVAGARHVLQLEQYRWVAPLSAFYPDLTTEVDLTGWNPTFPRSSLTARKKPQSTCELRPDYIALRLTASPMGGESYEWAVAEAKGTSLCLKNMSNLPNRMVRAGTKHCNHGKQHRDCCAAILGNSDSCEPKC